MSILNMASIKSSRQSRWENRISKLTSRSLHVANFSEEKDITQLECSSRNVSIASMPCDDERDAIIQLPIRLNYAVESCRNLKLKNSPPITKMKFDKENDVHIPCSSYSFKYSEKRQKEFPARSDVSRNPTPTTSQNGENAINIQLATFQDLLIDSTRSEDKEESESSLLKKPVVDNMSSDSEEDDSVIYCIIKRHIQYGWKLLDTNCGKCDMPLMFKSEESQEVCLQCCSLDEELNSEIAKIEEKSRRENQIRVDLAEESVMFAERRVQELTAQAVLDAEVERKDNKNNLIASAKRSEEKKLAAEKREKVSTEAKLLSEAKISQLQSKNDYLENIINGKKIQTEVKHVEKHGDSNCKMKGSKTISLRIPTDFDPLDENAMQRILRILALKVRMFSSHEKNNRVSIRPQKKISEPRAAIDTQTVHSSSRSSSKFLMPNSSSRRSRSRVRSIDIRTRSISKIRPKPGISTREYAKPPTSRSTFRTHSSSSIPPRPGIRASSPRPSPAIRSKRPDSVVSLTRNRPSPFTRSQDDATVSSVRSRPSPVGMVVTSPKRVCNLDDTSQLSDEEYLSSRRNRGRARPNPRPSVEEIFRSSLSIPPRHHIRSLSPRPTPPGLRVLSSDQSIKSRRSSSTRQSLLGRKAASSDVSVSSTRRRPSPVGVSV